jgi:Smg protein
MTTGGVLDILIYVFDRYMLDEVTEVPEREHLVRDLERAGFTQSTVERALDWLAELASEQGEREWLATGGAGTGLRIYSDEEISRLSRECRGLLLKLERAGALSPSQRELVIERLLALDADDLTTEQLKWVVRMVLLSQPEDDLSFERLESLMSGAHGDAAH